MELCEVNSQISHFQHVLNVIGVGILDVELRRQHTENHLAIFRRLNTRVSMIAHDIGDVGRLGEGVWKGFGAIRSEVSVDMPGFSEVIRTLDEHSGWSESCENYDQMSEMKFRLQVQLNCCIFLSILRLPPRIFQCSVRKRIR